MFVNVVAEAGRGYGSAGRGVIAGVVLITALAVGAEAASGQERPAAAEVELDSLRVRVAELAARIDSLEVVLERLRSEGVAGAPSEVVAPAAARADEVEEDEEGEEDAVAALRAAAVEALGGGDAQDDTATDRSDDSETGGFVGRQRAQQALNPEITVTADLFAFVDAADPGQDNFVPRVLELSMQSALDPYTRAKIFLGRHTHGGEISPFGEGHDHAGEEGEGELPGGEEEGEAHGEEEAGIELEEGYAEWVGLPGGLGLTVGKFRQRFGTLNRWHSHALPGQQLPLPYQAFFGEDGLAQTGVSVHWLAPVSGIGTYETWFQVTRSGNELLFGEDHGISALGHVNAFYDLGPSTYLEIGASGVAGPGADASWGTRVGGVDVALSWRPPERGRYREAMLRGGAVYGRLGLEDGTYTEPAWGGFAIGEYRLNRRWVVGARYERTQNPLEPDEAAWLAAPTLTWWQSEFVRIRAEFDYLRRPNETLRQFLIQTTISMGPHRHESY
ncbi:MAG: hypothetical protein ACOC8B_01370 [Gemmatimonadota bacterium]